MEVTEAAHQAVEAFAMTHRPGVDDPLEQTFCVEELEVAAEAAVVAAAAKAAAKATAKVNKVLGNAQLAVSYLR